LWLRLCRQSFAGAGILACKSCRAARAGASSDVKRLVREQLDSVFTATSHPSQVRVSPPVPDPRGRGWTACVRAELRSVTGNALGTQTYRLFISEGAISDRRHIDGGDTCISEKYDPV